MSWLLRTLGTADESVTRNSMMFKAGESSAPLYHIPHSPLLVLYSHHSRMPLSISDKGAFLTSDALTKIAAATISSSSLRISTVDAECSIELISSSEMQTLPTQNVKLTAIDEASIYPIGIGGDPTRNFYYVSIAWNAGQLLRKKFGLPPKPSRIYLNTNHGQDDMDTPLLYTIPQDELSLDALDHIAFSHLQLGRLQQARELAEALCKRAPESEKGWTRLGDIALQQKAYKLAMLAFGRVLHLTPKEKVLGYVKRRMLECADHTEWGHVFQKGEVEQLPANLESILLVPWTQDARSQLQDIYGDEKFPSLTLDSRIPLTTTLPNTAEPFELPSFFRWIVPFHFAVMSTPRNEEDISILASPILGIHHVVTLTEEAPLDEKWFVGKRITHTHMPIEHYQCPTLEQVDLIIEMFQDENKLPLLVHCAGGKGRTGTIAACYIAAYGFNVSSPERTQPLISPSAAINALELIRPRLSRTPQQDEFVGKWISTVWKRHSILPERMSEPPPCSLEILGDIPPDADLLMLCGLQGRPVVHATCRTDHPRQVQENPGFAVPSAVVILMLGRGSARTNLEVAASRRRTSPVRRDVVSSSIVAIPTLQTGGTGSPSRTGQSNPFAYGSITLLTCVSLGRNSGRTTVLSFLARAFGPPSLLP